MAFRTWWLGVVPLLLSLPTGCSDGKLSESAQDRTLQLALKWFPKPSTVDSMRRKCTAISRRRASKSKFCLEDPVPR